MDIEKFRDYETIFQNMADVVMLLDGNGIIKRVNPAATHLLIYKEKELLGKKIEDFIYEDPEQKLKNCFSRKKSLCNYEVTFLNRDGKKVALTINISIVGDKENKKIIISGRNMEKVKTLIRDLENSYRELEATQEQLIRSEKLASAGRMAASVAHEIRNPLNVISISTQQLNKKFKESPFTEPYVSLITKNIERLNHLIEEFVNCARPPQLKMKLSNIRKILDEVISAIAEKCKKSKIRIIKNIEPRLPRIKLDRERIYQAFFNIALNGIQSMSHRGTLTIEVGSDEKSMKIKFIDTGKGIPKEDMIKLFDPFFTTKSEGMGLGLAVCYAIISSHQGRIDVESEKGETAFTVELPFLISGGGNTF